VQRYYFFLRYANIIDQKFILFAFLSAVSCQLSALSIQLSAVSKRGVKKPPPRMEMVAG